MWSKGHTFIICAAATCVFKRVCCGFTCSPRLWFGISVKVSICVVYRREELGVAGERHVLVTL